jgi:hypothetical protein
MTGIRIMGELKTGENMNTIGFDIVDDKLVIETKVEGKSVCETKLPKLRALELLWSLENEIHQTWASMPSVEVLNEILPYIRDTMSFAYTTKGEHLDDGSTIYTVVIPGKEPAYIKEFKDKDGVMHQSVERFNNR